ncbi:MAG: asparaginase domain-containing protein [bacterium]
MKIKIFTVGGTIDKIYFDKKSDYDVGESIIGDILREANVSFDFECQAIMSKDSLDMTAADRQLVFDRVQQDTNKRVVITHGTDTMIDTARKLMAIEGKVIVLTGSMQPARFKASDAEFNVGCAIAAVQALPEGVYIVMNGCIFHPDKCKKNREHNRFENM